MHLAVLMTNTDETAFSQQHPKDGEKFAQMIKAVRPDWTTISFSVKDNVFPDDLSSFDGVMITGSPASVHDAAPWVSRLEDTIRQLYHAKTPMFGACFGHQAIAKALGGRVEKNPSGWVFGLAKVEVIAKPNWTQNLNSNLRQYAAHIEQVTELPQGAQVLLRSDACPIAGYSIGNTVYTTQNHPEMTHEFITALVEEYADEMESHVIADARTSLSQKAHSTEYAETIARFFEQAP